MLFDKSQVADMVVTQRTVNSSVETQGGSLHVSSMYLPRFSINYSLKPLVGMEGKQVLANINALRGRLGVTEVPIADANLGTQSQPIDIVDGVSGSDTVKLFLSPNKNIVSGDFIKFSNGTKVYQVVNNVVNNSHVRVLRTLKITPPLQKTVSGSTCLFSNFNFTVRLKKDEQNYVRKNPNIYYINVSVEEVI